MKFICNLGAKWCNLEEVQRNARSGDEIVLQAPESQKWIAENVAANIRSHLATLRRNVICGRSRGATCSAAFA